MTRTDAHRWSRSRSLAAAAAAAVAALVVSGLPTASAADPAPAPVPVTPVFSGPVDVKPEYQGQVLCSPTPKKGTVRLGELIKATYPQYTTIGMARSCSQGGQSEHKDGRALDWMVSVRDAGQKAAAEAFLGWLLAPDAAGVPAANARRLGVMYIGWDDRIWRGYGTTGWDELFDCESNPDRATPSYDNYCHRNHVHISLSWDGAAGMTSFYDGSSLTAAACAAPTTTPSAPAAAAYRLVPVVSTRVVNTLTAFGTPTSCRAYGPGWSGQRRAVAFKVTGRGGVPTTGVGAVLLRVYPASSNTTSTVRVWTTGSSSPTSTPAATTYAGRYMTSTYVVPVASDGTVRVSTSYGAAGIAADVLAWAPSATALAATTSGRGNIEVQAPQRAATVTLEAGETIVVPLAGKAGVPASGLTGVQLHVTATGTTSASRGSIRVGSLTGTGAAKLPPQFTATVGGTAPRSASTTVASQDGRVVVRNYATGPVTVSLDVLGWYGSGTDDTGLRFVPRTPTKIIDSTTGYGLGAALVADTPATAAVPATAVPAGTAGLVLSVQTRGRTGPGGLVIAPTGVAATGRSIDVIRSIWVTDLVMVPLGTDLGLTLTSLGTGADVRAYVVGYLR